MNLLSVLLSVVTFLADTTSQIVQEAPNLVPIGAAIAVFTGLGAGVGMGIATGKAVEAVARQPEASGKIQTILLFGLAFAETTAIYGTFVAIVLMFVI